MRTRNTKQALSHLVRKPPPLLRLQMGRVGSYEVVIAHVAPFIRRSAHKQLFAQIGEWRGSPSKHGTHCSRTLWSLRIKLVIEAYGFGADGDLIGTGCWSIHLDEGELTSLFGELVLE